MKPTIYFLLTLIVLSFSTATQAQNSYRDKIEFTYKQLPLYPISAEKTYKRELINTFEQDIATEKEAIETENARLKKEAADEKKAYQEKSTGEKLLSKVVLGETKPSGQAQTLQQPFYPKVWDPASTLASYVNVPGMSISESAKAVVKVYVERFTHTVDFQQTEKGWYYRVNVGLPVRLEVYNEAGVQLAAQVFEVSQIGKSNDFQSEFFDSERKRDDHWKINQQGKLRQLESNRFNINMKSLQNYLVENLGYNQATRKTSIGLVKDKKNDTYVDINGVYPKVVEAYNKLSGGLNDDIKKTLTDAISVWEGELKDLNPDDKKARINREIGQDLYLNIAEAHVWMGNYAEAQNTLIKYKVLDPKGKDKQYKDINDLYEDQKKRAAANSL